MIFKSLLLVGLISTAAADMQHGNLRREAVEHEAPSMGIEHLDLEIVHENGDRELFPLLPGTKCPTGHQCRVRSNPNFLVGMSPMSNAIKNSMKTPLAMSLNWGEFNSNIKTVVASDNFCTRRAAMARAAGLAAGASVAAVSQPAYAAETKEVKMGSDTGLLAFVPNKVQICKGDSVKWINNKGGPHNVVFDEDGIPAGVDQEKISMFDQMGDENESFTMTFEKAGEYNYYCEPHRGAGMNAVLIVV